MLRTLCTLGRFSTRNSGSFGFATAKKTAKDYSKLSYYEILNVSPSATQKQIKANYYELAKKYHPDTYKGSDTDIFKHVQAAYEVLKNPAKRKEYDAKNNVGFSYRDFTDNGKSSEGQEQTKKKKDMFQDIEIDENMNFDEEYAKFFGKKPEASPDTVVVQEHVFLEQLDREERMRYEYKHYRNNQHLYFIKYAHQSGYDATVDDVINVANRRVEMTDEVRERVQDAENERSSWIYGFLKAGIVVILVPTIMMTFHRRMSAQKGMMHDMVDYVKDIDESEIKQIQSRFVFEGEK